MLWNKTYRTKGWHHTNKYFAMANTRYIHICMYYMFGFWMLYLTFLSEVFLSWRRIYMHTICLNAKTFCAFISSLVSCDKLVILLWLPSF